MREFGIRMGGCESEIEHLFIDYLKASKDNEFKYLEIGAASCVTLRAIYDIVKENIKHDKWKVIGVDIDGGWSVDWNTIKSKFSDKEIDVWTNRLTGGNIPVPHADLWIDKNPRELISTHLKDIDICFIDACHGKCVAHDFVCVEKNIKSGGIAFFHDVGVLEQGTDWQEHCKEFINVRKHLIELGLFDNKYPNWVFEKEIKGSRFWGGDGNSCGVFRKL